MDLCKGFTRGAILELKTLQYLDESIGIRLKRLR